MVRLYRSVPQNLKSRKAYDDNNNNKCVRIDVYVLVCSCVRVCVYMRVRVFMHVFARMCAYTCTHAHTLTQPTVLISFGICIIGISVSHTPNHLVEEETEDDASLTCVSKGK